MISRLFEKYRSNQNSIKRVRNSLLEVGLVIEQEVMLWLKKLHRRLSPRKKARKSMDCGSNEGFARQRFRFHYGDDKESTVELWGDPLRKP